MNGAERRWKKMIDLEFWSSFRKHISRFFVPWAWETKKKICDLTSISDKSEHSYTLAIKKVNNKKNDFETKKKDSWSQSYIRQIEPHFNGFWRSKTFLKWKNTMLNFRNINSFQHLQEDLLKFQLLLSLHFSKVRLLFDHQRLQMLSTNAFWEPSENNGF